MRPVPASPRFGVNNAPIFKMMDELAACVSDINEVMDEAVDRLMGLGRGKRHINDVKVRCCRGTKLLSQTAYLCPRPVPVQVERA